MKTTFFFLVFLLSLGCSSANLKNLCDPSNSSSYLLMQHLLTSGQSSDACGISRAQIYLAPEPTFLLAKDNGIIESGFLIGKVTSETATVEVSLDDSAFFAAAGNGNWKYSLPSAANTWKLGSLHKISIRSRNKDRLSTTLSINLRKGKNKDINGDGFPDIIIGSASDDSLLGKINVFLGSETGFNFSQSSSLITSITGTGIQSRLGLSIASGDFNGDGYADVITGAPRFDLFGGQDGQVYIFYGSLSGIASGSASNADTIVSAGVTGGWLGRAVSAGDLNGDGYDEAIIGSYLYSSGQGRIYIIKGRSTKLVSGNDVAVADTIITGTAAARIGESLETGDFNADGFVDLVSGATEANNGSAAQGRVYIFNGKSIGIVTGDDTTANTILSGTNVSTNSKLGCALGYGDVNGDGIHDLLMTACRGNNNGRVYIFHGNKNGITTANDTSANSILTSTKTTGIFGNVLSTADINGDSISDLLVGSPAVSSSLGEAYIFYASSSGVSATSETGADSTFTGTTAAGEFGYTLTALDYDADFKTDLLISSPGGNKDVLQFFKNTGTGISGGSDTSAAQKIQGGSGSRFGESLVR